MSKISKISWLLSALCFVLFVVVRTLLGGWINLMAIPLILFFVFGAVAVFADTKFYLSFFRLRTTKNGMNMGLALFMGFALLISVNYMGVRFHKAWDLTEEGLNSISPQSQQVLKQLDSEIEFLIFYAGEGETQVKKTIVDTLELYRNKSRKVKISPVNAVIEKAATIEILKDIKNPKSPFVMARYKDKRIVVDFPAKEPQITSAIIKATRASSKVIYFLTGHGERSLQGEEPTSISEWVSSLEESSYRVEKLSLVNGDKLPSSKSVIAVVGPVSPISDAELKLLREFARNGGRFLVLLDPGQKHRAAMLTNVFGIEFRNNYIFNDRVQLMGRGATSSLGMVYETSSPITEGFRSGENMTLFDLASEVARSPQAPKNLDYKELVLTHESSYVVNDLQKVDNTADRRAVTVAMSVEGPLSATTVEGSKGTRVSDSSAAIEKSKGFAAVVVGDSDFVSNASFFQGLNRDLAMNAVSFLAKEDDLISLRSKSAKGTKLMLTSTDQAGVILVGIAIPLILFIWSGLTWFRRRGA